jgi:phage shock protein A
MSGFFSKFIVASKEGARAVGEFSVDANEIRLSTQEITNAKKTLITAKKDLEEIPVKELECEQEIQRLQQEIDNHERHAVEALKRGNETVVEELAEKLAELHQEVATLKAVKTQYSDHTNRLKDLMKKIERTILEHERELTMVKTTDSVQKATKSIIHSHSEGATPLLKAKNTLDRIKQRQKAVEHRWATEEKLEKALDGSSLSGKTQANSKDAKNIALQRIHKLAGK